MVVLRYRSVDTMKGSKDSCDNAWSEAHIAQVVALCADLGVTHIAVSTPWDYSGQGQHTPAYLGRWVAAIRAAGKAVWFRCHPIRWERDYGATGLMTPSAYLASMEQFIRSSTGMFRAGDIWDGCPEPENGKYWNEVHSPAQFNGWMYNDAPNAATAEYSQFFIDVTDRSDAAFASVGVTGVTTTLRSTNGTVAQRRQTLHPEAVARMGCITTDSYTGQASADPTVVAQSLIDELYAIRAARDEVPATAHLPIVLGERGYSTTIRPSDEEQRAVIVEVNRRLAAIPFVQGDNYWVAFGEDDTENSRLLGGSRGQYTPRPAFAAIRSYYLAAHAPRELPLGIDVVSPANVATGGDAFSLSIRGTGFTETSVGYWDGAVRPTRFVPPDQLTLQISATDIARPVTIPITIVDTNPERASAPLLFPVSGLLLSPSTAPALTESLRLTVTAVNMTFETTATVRWNGSPRATQWISPTELRATILARDLGQPGAVQVTVA